MSCSVPRTADRRPRPFRPPSTSAHRADKLTDRPTFTIRRRFALMIACSLWAAGCGGRFEVKSVPASGIDAAVVLGCPSESDGRLSRCQMTRAAWAAELWKRGAVRNFITSGAAVYTPYVEAEALAEALAALGVPAEHIFLEPDALHTDENVYNGMRVADALGFRSVAVVSQKGHAAWGCRLMIDWGHPCGALSVNMDLVRARAADFASRLGSVRSARVADGAWLPLAERERRRAMETGGKKRPPSLLLYPYLFLARGGADRWTPPAPLVVPRKSWAERRIELAQESGDHRRDNGLPGMVPITQEVVR